jgi:hypothetical protein
VTNAAPTTSEDLGRPASGRLAARADAITKAYGGGDARVTALDEVTVGIPRGGFTAVMGPSARASRRSCTAWPGSTRSTPAACWSATWT